MNKYRVLKSYPKSITNSGRLVTLKPNTSVYLKKEPQVLRLVSLGFIKPVIEIPKKVKKKPMKKPQPAREVKYNKSEVLNKKKNKDNKLKSQD